MPTVRRNKNPFLEALRDVERESDYEEVMRGIGHVTVAVSFAEFVVDTLGWHLTGDFDAYQANTNRMPLGRKTEHIAKLSNTRITEPGLRDRMTRFCGKLRVLLVKRNDAVHSLYFKEKVRVVGVRLPIGKHAVKTATVGEFSELANHVWQLLGDDSLLVKDVENWLSQNRPAEPTPRSA